MSNPVYDQPHASIEANQDAKLKMRNEPQKYHAKIDTNMRINNLTQEVNMPLLRLAHQLYSIIEDTVDYDKEQNKLNNYNSLTTEELMLTESLLNTENFPNQSVFFNRNSFKNNRYSSGSKKDCWKFMEDIVEMRELPPGQKYQEKDEISNLKKSKSIVVCFLLTFLISNGIFKLKTNNLIFLDKNNN